MEVPSWSIEGSSIRKANNMIPRASVGYKMVKAIVEKEDCSVDEVIKDVAWFVGLSDNDQELIRKEFEKG